MACSVGRSIVRAIPQHNYRYYKSSTEPPCYIFAEQMKAPDINSKKDLVL